MPRRPGSVTFVAVLTFLNGILNVIGGAVILFTRDSLVRTTDAGAVASVTTSAILSLVLGIVMLVVARGLLRGNTVARVLVAIVMVISIVNGVLLLFSLQFFSGILEILWAILVLAFLFTRRASAFFAGDASA